MDPSSPDQLQNEKRALRKDMAERRQRLDIVEAQRLSGLAAARLRDVPAFERAGAGKTVAGFLALITRGEADPAAALAAARARGAVVVYPRVETTVPRLRFHRADSADDLVPGPYGLVQPAPSCPELPVERIDVVLAPGLAFDLTGRRLGFGGGYYDETAARLRQAGPGQGAVLIGFGYDFQIVDRRPAGGGDLALGWVATDQRAARPGAAA